MPLSPRSRISLECRDMALPQEAGGAFAFPPAGYSSLALIPHTTPPSVMSADRSGALSSPPIPP